MLSKNKQRKQRRYGPKPPVYALGENRIFQELREGSGVVTIGGFGVIRSKETATMRKRETIAAGKRWTAGAYTQGS